MIGAGDESGVGCTARYNTSCAINAIRHREPPLGGAAIQAERSVQLAWIASSQALLAMTVSVNRQASDALPHVRNA
jgi:hypothetical protein